MEIGRRSGSVESLKAHQHVASSLFNPPSLIVQREALHKVTKGFYLSSGGIETLGGVFKLLFIEGAQTLHDVTLHFHTFLPTFYLWCNLVWSHSVGNWFCSGQQSNLCSDGQKSGLVGCRTIQLDAEVFFLHIRLHQACFEAQHY